MTDIGVPGTYDGPPLPANVAGEIIVTFLDNGTPPSVQWPRRVNGRLPRDVIGEAIRSLQMLLEGDMLEKCEEDPPREPPL